MAIIAVKACQCNKCGHVWLPKSYNKKGRKYALPKCCADCKTPVWNKPGVGKKIEENSELVAPAS